MKWEKSDGIIEISYSGCCCPPGKIRSGQHTNNGTSWWRVDNGPRHIVNWLSETRRSAMESRTVSEFLTDYTYYYFGDKNMYQKV